MENTTKYDKQIFGANMKHYMKLRGYNQKELAQKLEVIPTAVCDWASGKKFPRIDSVAKIAAVLNVSVPDLIGRDIIKENEEDFIIDVYRVLDDKRKSMMTSYVRWLLNEQKKEMEI